VFPPFLPIDKPTVPITVIHQIVLWQKKIFNPHKMCRHTAPDLDVASLPMAEQEYCSQIERKLREWYPQKFDAPPAAGYPPVAVGAGGALGGGDAPAAALSPASQQAARLQLNVCVPGARSPSLCRHSPDR
jgi:hypothetical protein